MKKLISAVLILTLIVSLAAIGISPAFAEGETFKVGICNFVDDASLNQIIANIRSQLDSISRDYIPQPEADEAAGAADVEEAVRSIEDSASIIQPEMNFSLDLGPAEEPEAEVSLESTQPFTV